MTTKTHSRRDGDHPGRPPPPGRSPRPGPRGPPIRARPAPAAGGLPGAGVGAAWPGGTPAAARARARAALKAGTNPLAKAAPMPSPLTTLRNDSRETRRIDVSSTTTASVLGNIKALSSSALGSFAASTLSWIMASCDPPSVAEVLGAGAPGGPDPPDPPGKPGRPDMPGMLKDMPPLGPPGPPAPGADPPGP